MTAKVRTRAPRPAAHVPVPPTLKTRDGTRLHVYRKPTDMTPAATFDQRGSFWVNVRDPKDRYPNIPDAARSVVAADHPAPTVIRREEMFP